MEMEILSKETKGLTVAQEHSQPIDDKLDSPGHPNANPPSSTLASKLYTAVCLLLLFLNFFLAQYDKFVLSYFQANVITSLHLSSNDYGILSGYATGIVYALLAIPVAFVADYTEARIWVLSVAALSWSLCVLFQGLSHNFWQILLARIGMGIGQAPVEALSISIISDLVEPKWLFLSESLFYVSVYVGEAVSGQIATAFDKTGTPWNEALKAIGIVGMVVGVLTRLIMREPPRRAPIVPLALATDPAIAPTATPTDRKHWKVAHAKRQFLASLSHVMRLKSFWLLTLSSGARQFSGNVFGWYMPAYLTSVYPSEPNLLSNYGIIVGAVGSVTVVLGGLICSAAGKNRASTALYLTGIGGMISSVFVILMVFSRSVAGGSQANGVKILYGVMSAAYLTAELWLGAFASVLALIMPARTKTFGLAIYTSTIILIYSSAPQIIGLALRNYDPESAAYVQQERNILAALIPVGYWVGGIGFLLAIPKVRADLAGELVEIGNVSWRRKVGLSAFVFILASMTVSMFVTSFAVPGQIG